MKPAQNGWNTELTTGAIIQSQNNRPCGSSLANEDAGTSGDLVMGYVIDDNNHENLVNLTNGNDINSARIHVKVPVTNGGNAVIAAKNSSGTIVWSWHIWISDYVPVGLSGDITTINRNKAIEAAQNATQEGMVQVYGGISWTDPNGAFTDASSWIVIWELSGRHADKSIGWRKNFWVALSGWPERSVL